MSHKSQPTDSQTDPKHPPPSPSAGESSSVMMWATVNITNHRACQESYRRSSSRVDGDEHLCASGNDLKQEGCVPGAGDGSCRGGVDACEVGAVDDVLVEMEKVKADCIKHAAALKKKGR